MGSHAKTVLSQLLCTRGRSEADAVAAVLAGEADVAAIGSSTWEAMGREELSRARFRPKQLDIGSEL